MQIFVSTNSGTTLTLTVEPTDSIASVKCKIKKGAVDEELNRSFELIDMDDPSTVLVDNRTLSDYNIEDNAHLRLSGWSIIVTPSCSVGMWADREWEKTMTFGVHRGTSVDDLKAMIKEKIRYGHRNLYTLHTLRFGVSARN